MRNYKKVLFALLGSYLYPAALFAQKVIPAVEAVQEKTAPAVSNSLVPIAEKTMVASGSAIASGSLGLLGTMPENYTFLLSTLGMGGVAGWSVGYTLKKVAKAVAIIIGVVFIAMQYLAFKQFITIDWDKIQCWFNGTAGNAGFFESFSSIITHNLPFAGSFVAGFWIGFKKG